MLDYLKIQTANSKLNRYIYWQIIISLVKAVYIIFVNIQFLGRSSEDHWCFLLSSYKQIFQENISFFHKVFYYILGKKLIHIYEYKGSKVGFGLFRINPIWTIHMCKFGILDKFQGKGLSKVFLLKSINNWSKQGFKRVSVYVDPENYIARKSYESVGFRPIKFLTTQIYLEKNM